MIINYFGTDVRVWDTYGYLHTFAKDRAAPRLKVKEIEHIKALGADFTVFEHTETIQGLPPERDGFFLIVACSIKQALPTRKDLIVPCYGMLDKDHGIYAYRGFH